MKKEIEFWLLGTIYPKLGIDRPDTHDRIAKFIEEDVKSAADPDYYNDDDFAIAFRRMLEHSMKDFKGEFEN